MKISSFCRLTGLLMLFGSLAGCTTPKPIATVLLTDKSASALNDPRFSELASLSCHTLAREMLPQDVTGQVIVSGTEPRATDLIVVEDTRLLHRACQPASEVVVSASKGTLSCAAFNLAFDQTHRQAAADYPVLYLSVIQVNELEKPCPDVWKRVADDAAKRKGKLLIVGSGLGDATTPGVNNGFNHLLWAHLKSSPSTVFCDESAIQRCIEQATNDLRLAGGSDQ